MKKLFIAMLVVSFTSAAAYAGPQERGMATGAAIGATAGAVIGSQTNETAQGAIVGAMFGAIAGAILSNVHATPVHYSNHRPVHVQKREYQHVRERRHGHYRDNHAYRNGKRYGRHDVRHAKNYRGNDSYQRGHEGHEHHEYREQQRQSDRHVQNSRVRSNDRQMFTRHSLVRPGSRVDHYAYAGR